MGQFDDGSLDIIYIDGDHTYEVVVKDLAAWYPGFKKACFAGMILAGL